MNGADIKLLLFTMGGRREAVKQGLLTDQPRLKHGGCNTATAIYSMVPVGSSHYNQCTTETWGVLQQSFALSACSILPDCHVQFHPLSMDSRFSSLAIPFHQTSRATSTLPV
jgi:hypothetical protein